MRQKLGKMSCHDAKRRIPPPYHRLRAFPTLFTHVPETRYWVMAPFIINELKGGGSWREGKKKKRKKKKNSNARFGMLI